MLDFLLILLLILLSLFLLLLLFLLFLLLLFLLLLLLLLLLFFSFFPDELQLLKVTHVPARPGPTLQDKTHISQTISLNRAGGSGARQTVATMEVYRTEVNVTVYLSTEEGIYNIPAHNCHTYRDCR